MEDGKVIRVGSRKSELALIQTKHTISLLQKHFPKIKFEIHKMSTMGDRVLNISLPKIGEKSLFTKDLEEALRNGGVDFVVHSLKDLPTSLPEGMAIGAVLEREDPRDALVLRENYKQFTLKTLPKGSIIGTSSLRRTAQIRRQYPQLVVCDIRGNLNTRLAKLDAVDSKFAGIILAQAGLVRMGWMSRISQVLEPTDLLYAVGQGALAVECRANDQEILSMLQKLMCLKTTCRILAERSFLKTLGGGCSAPVAVCSKLCTMNGNDNDFDTGLSLVGAVWSLDGTTEIHDEKECSLNLEQKSLVRSKIRAANALDDDDESNEAPPNKRARSNGSSSPELQVQDSPPVINEDAEVEELTSAYNVNEIIETHIDYVKHLPGVISQNQTDIINNNRNGSTQMHLGNGDGLIDTARCPISMDVGQDFMGECPVVNNKTKVNMAIAGKCPLTNNDNNATNTDKDETDYVKPSSSSKCPFITMHNTTTTDFRKKNIIPGKCPFLQTVKMFDYPDEKKPTPTNVLIEDVGNLFCGLYRHACYKTELYTKSDQLGKMLAEELIKKGALDVMKHAQAEIHSKA